MINRKMSLSLALVLAVIAVLLTVAPAWRVQAQPANAVTNTVTVGVDCPTIQACIDSIPSNGVWNTVIIPAGVYTENVTISNTTAFISLVGAGRYLTTIKAARGGHAVVEVNNVTFKASGLRLTGAYSATFGGGLMITNTLVNIHLSDLRLDHNQAVYGGGLYANGAKLYLDHSEILSNIATVSGGGAYVTGTLYPSSGNYYFWTILFANNVAPDAQYVSPMAYQHQLDNITFANYPAVRNMAAMKVSNSSSNRVFDTLIVSHTIGIQSMTSEGLSEWGNLYSVVATPTVGSISSNQSVVISQAVMFVDPAHDDYHLACASSTPGCVSATDVSNMPPLLSVGGDIDGEARPFPYNTAGAKYDAGYDEWLVYPDVQIMTPTAGALITSTPILVSGVISPQGAIVKSMTLTLDGGATWIPLAGTLIGDARYWTYTDYRALDGVTLTLQAVQQNTLNNPLRYSAVITAVVDNVLPSAAIADPGVGQIIRTHAYTVTGTTHDGSGVSRLELSLDNGLTYSDVQPSGNWSWPWAIPDEDGVSHVLRVRVTDGAGNVNNLAPLAVFVDNVPPTITFTTIAPGQIVTTDPITIAGYSNGAVTTTLNLGTGSQMVNSDGFALPLYTHANGSYVITATALDAVGNRTTQAVPFTVQVSPHTIPCLSCTTTSDLQAALDGARQGDRVVLPTGVTISGPVTVPAGISLIGGGVQAQPDLVPGDGATILGDGTGPVITIDGARPNANVALTTTIADLTIRGGAANLGGGILITGGATSLIAGNVITANTATTNGGAVAVANHATATLDGNWIENNDNPSGSAVYVDGTSQLLAVNNLILRNTAGALEAALDAHLAAYHNDLMWNYVGLTSAGTTTVTNNIIFENAGVGLARLAGRLTADYNDLAQNAPDRSGLVAGLHDQVSVPLWSGGYHLSGSAPQVDAGDPTVLLAHDAAGLLRPIGSGPDLGAYEYGNNLLHQVFLPLLFRDYDPARDAYEPDDTVAQAKPIQTGDVQHHNFYPVNDVDWVRFDALPGTYLINTLNLAANTDTVLHLYASNGVTPLAQNDDCSSDTRASCLTWTVATSSTLYLQVSPYDANSVGPDHGYDLAIVKQ